ncbi:Retrovirus-related Pol polyprotein from transposon TNT 1-94 [Quillaja saponaria]|uniref:Retrovirus-related Pol polyprotein from transposon TNT 1-94 n=1 Tax=Quillaja saponaria TaxID=32244 RepID=A0AAD7LKY7_QUISA|nr:Retrovirus-related Pol polyprotein from transposon TNT 1-94 [Quillaja saponaria]
MSTSEKSEISMSKFSTFISVFSRSPVITTANIVQLANSLEVSPSKDKPINVLLSTTEYDKLLQYQATQQSFLGNFVACLSQTLSDTWILDSGVSDHISESVLYVPECSFRLISISQLTRSLNCSVTFIDDSFTIHDRRMGRTIGTGHESQGLYHLTTLPTSSVACSTNVSPILIHSRLGHPSLSKLQKMVPRLSSLSSLNCESCQLGKHTRTSFPKHSRFRAESPFHLVHTDVWGTRRVSSFLGFQYFVTFIDDYSRCT